MYFPQFHEFDVNNRLWGKGYTDFRGVRNTTVARHDYPVIRPLDGFYNLLDTRLRSRQARVASAYNLYGFVIMHYWFKGGPVMEKPLEALLVDGEPDINFCIMWANEHWTSRWDGGQNNILMEQTFDEDDWKPHFDYLLRLFRHRNYILHNGAPMLVLYRIKEISQVHQMLVMWRRWAVDAGFTGLYIVQTNGVEWKKGSLLRSPDADAVFEYYPNFYNGPVKPVSFLQTTNAAKSGVSELNYFFGAHAAWNNKPRHMNDGNEGIVPYHPVNLKAALRYQLRRTPLDSYVFLNSWNEWGEGASVEPSVEFGYSWLQAVKEAVDEDRENLPVVNVPRAGLPVGRAAGQSVCILVRTYVAHDQNNLFSLEKLLSQLSALEHGNWKAFIFDSGTPSFRGLKSLIDGFGDRRLHYSPTPSKFAVPYDSRTSAYPLTDYMLQENCLSSNEFDWFIVTNGDNFYSSDALNTLPFSKDVVLMNYFGRYSLVNSMRDTLANMTHCCSRLASYSCSPSSLEIGKVDLGAMVIRISKWQSAGFTFNEFTGFCGKASCHDGALAERMHALSWTVEYHPASVCAFYHNPNPVSCKLVGGTYYDIPDIAKAGCYDPVHLYDQLYWSGIQNDWKPYLSRVDWAKYFAHGCVCPRID